MSTEREIKCYGMTAAEVREEYGNSITAKVAGLEMVVMSLLSDVQELLAFAGSKEHVLNEVRMQLNVAKLLLSDIRSAKM